MESVKQNLDIIISKKRFAYLRNPMLVFANLVNGRITDVGSLHIEAALVDGLGDFLFESHRSGILRLCNSVRGDESKKFHSCRLSISRKTFFILSTLIELQMIVRL